jgi:hypothetical protein
MEVLLILLVIGIAVFAFQRSAANRRHAELEERRAADLAQVRRVAEEDVTRFGEELQRLDTEMLTASLDEAARQDYQRALDAYEAAKETLASMSHPDDVKHVTERLEDGRYAAACVVARTKGEPLPTRRPPCFFNPGHGPSTTDIEWAPPGGRPRQIPVCAADADRVAQGAEPDIRTVQQGMQRVPYWQGGPAYSPYAHGYFGGYAMSGLLPGFLLGGMLMGGWDDPGFEGDGGGDAGDAGDDYGAGDGDAGGGDADAGGDWGGDAGGGDWGGGDFGGDFGGFDF